MICRTCKFWKAPIDFGIRKSTGKYHTQCRRCRSDYDKEYYYKTKLKRLQLKAATQSARREEKKQFIRAYKANIGCQDCGEKDPIVLTFDHTNGKNYTIANMFNFSIENIIKEIEDCKCEVVCANCHARRTEKRRQSGISV